jgi:hypothetical protein
MTVGVRRSDDEINELETSCEDPINANANPANLKRQIADISIQPCKRKDKMKIDITLTPRLPSQLLQPPKVLIFLRPTIRKPLIQPLRGLR